MLGARRRRGGASGGAARWEAAGDAGGGSRKGRSGRRMTRHPTDWRLCGGPRRRQRLEQRPPRAVRVGRTKKCVCAGPVSGGARIVMNEESALLHVSERRT